VAVVVAVGVVVGVGVGGRGGRRAVVDGSDVAVVSSTYKA
jgi:hypothetical protein